MNVIEDHPQESIYACKLSFGLKKKGTFFWFLHEVLNWFKLVPELESFQSEITVKT